MGHTTKIPWSEDFYRCSSFGALTDTPVLLAYEGELRRAHAMMESLYDDVPLPDVVTEEEENVRHLACLPSEFMQPPRSIWNLSVPHPLPAASIPGGRANGGE